MDHLQNKNADTEFELFPILQQRWSPRAFLDVEISDKQIKKMAEAFRWGPSAGNSQPWKLIIGKKRDSIWQKIFDGLEIGNQVWCKEAPLLMLIIGKIKNQDGKPINYSMYDCGGAAAQLTFQANADGIFIHQMAGIYADKLVESFGIPENFKVYTGLAGGNIGNPETLKEDLIEREKAKRIRKPLESILFSESSENFWEL